MKKYFLPFIALLLGCVCVQAADFAELLKKLDSDYSQSLTAETNVSWLGTTGNPNASLDVFQAREEIRNLMNEAANKPEELAKLNAFFVDALGKVTQATTKVWILEQLQAIGTAAEVPAVAAQLNSKDQIVVDAAAAALCQIPGPEAEAALAKDIPACKYALAQRKDPNPPYQPCETAMPQAISNCDQAKVDAWMAKYDQLDELTKAQTIAGLAARKDAKYHDVAVAAMKSDSEILRKAGFLAMEKLATAADLDAILAYPDDGLIARICGFIVADGFDEALKARMVKANRTDEFIFLASILINRAVDIRAEVFAKITANECDGRMALMQQVAKIATPADAKALVTTTLLFPVGGERDQAENLIAAVCNGDASAVVALKGQFPQEDLFPIIGRIGGDAAKAEVNAGLASNDADLRQAAIRALSVWPNAQFADKMFEVATAEGNYTPDQKIAALRSFIRVISLPDDKIGIGISKDGKLDKLKEAFKIATRVDEKRLILSRLAANRTAKSLQFAVECAADPELAEAAYAAIADHAHDNVLRQQNMDVFGPAMDLVITKSTNKDLVERVKKYKEQK